MHLIERNDYMSRLISLKDKDFIKVLSGIRRSGKSTLLEMFKTHLLESGIKESCILHINMDSWDVKKRITNKSELYEFIKENVSGERSYVFIDEIQNIRGWEDVAIAVYTDMDVDLYITGSNALMLSSDLSTKLVGRYIEIQVFPLSFKEFKGFFTESEKMEAFNEYLRFGGFPGVIKISDERNRNDAIESIYRTILSSDVVMKNNIKDVALMERLAEYLMGNVGNITSIKKISDYLNSSGIKTNPVTVDNYILMLVRSYLIYKAKRYDIKGKKVLKSLDKYYVTDIGLKNMVNPQTDLGHSIENLVYFELLRKGYQVYVGTIDQTEIDFIAKKGSDITYFQVSMTILDEAVRERELAPFKKIPDSHDRVILTLDRIITDNIDGIRCMNIVDFLLKY